MPTRQARKPDYEDDERREYRNLPFASSDYVPFWIGQLRIVGVDTSRMQTAGVPVLRSHNGDNPIGRVLNVRRDADLWRSTWTLPKIPGNQRSFDEMDSGINEGISVGANILWDTFTVDNEDPIEDLDDMRLSTEVLLIEQSLTPIPADARAGVNRTLGVDLDRDGSPYDALIAPDGVFPVGDTTALRSRLDTLRRTHNESVARKRAEVESMTTQQAISPDALERAISDALEKHDGVKRVGDLNTKLDTLLESDTKREKEMMDLGSKLQMIQFGGSSVLQLENWRPGRDHVVNLGTILQLSSTEDLGLPKLDPGRTTLEESLMERLELDKPGRNVVGQIPFAALQERHNQLDLQRATMANAAGARPLDINVLGDAGLLLSDYSPIMGRLDVRMGVTGAAKLPYATTQPTAAGGAEGADITVSNIILDNTEYLPVSVATAMELTSSLKAVDDMTVENIIRMAMFSVLNDEVIGQVLDGAGSTGNELAGMWSIASLDNTDYGATDADFSRDDVLDWLNHVRLAKTDGMGYTAIMSSGLWQLAERTLKGGSASDTFILESNEMGMGILEGSRAYHYAGLAPSGITNPGLYFKADRVVLWFFGNSFFLEFVPQAARKDLYKLVAEVNWAAVQPLSNISQIKQT